MVCRQSSLDFTELQLRFARGRSPRVAQRRPVSFDAFDLLAVGEVDFRSQPLSLRRQALMVMRQDVPPPLQLVSQSTDVDEARQ